MRAPHTPRRLLAGAAIALVLLGGTAACSSDGSDDAAETKTRTDTTATGGATETTAAEGTGTVTTVPDDGDRSEQAYVDAFTKGFDPDGELIPTAQAECVARRFVDVIGFDRIKSSGLTPEEFGAGDGETFPEDLGVDEQKAAELYEQFEACDVDLAAAFIEAFAMGSDADPEVTACLEKTVTDEALRQSFVNSFLGKDAKDPLEAAGDCFTGVRPDATPTSGG